jgi:cysteine desulfurase
MRVYLDNAASTKVDAEVAKAMAPYFTEKYGNASSLHQLGVEAKEALESSREAIAKKLKCSPDEIIFTSGGTESNNLALKGTAFANREKGNHIITSKIEHECILKSCEWLEKQGFKVTYLDVDEEGFVNPKDVAENIGKETILVSIIHANNEIGTIEPIEEISKICREKGVYFHTDACQSFTKVPLDTRNFDLVTINSHKIHGPKGVGALYIRKGTKIDSMMHGGGHEFNMRSGTENVAGIVGFAKAVEIAKEEHVKRMATLRDMLIDGILSSIGDVRLNGPRKKRLCNNVNMAFSFIEGESLMAYLDGEGIMVSTGSACSSKSLEPSHVLMAIGLKPEIAHGSLRMSLSKYTTKEEIEYTIGRLGAVVKKLRDISPLVRK